MHWLYMFVHTLGLRHFQHSTNRTGAYNTTDSAIHTSLSHATHLQNCTSLLFVQYICSENQR